MTATSESTTQIGMRSAAEMSASTGRCSISVAGRVSSLKTADTGLVVLAVRWNREATSALEGHGGTSREAMA